MKWSDDYRNPCVATEPIMFCFCLFLFLWAPCVATEPIIFCFCLFLFFLFTVRSQKLLNRFSPNFQKFCFPVSFEWSDSLKVILTLSCGKNAKEQPTFAQNFKSWLRFLTITSKRSKKFQIWNLTREIVSLNFWQISIETIQGLHKICFFCQIATFSSLTQKLFNRFARNFKDNCALWST